MARWTRGIDSRLKECVWFAAMIMVVSPAWGGAAAGQPQVALRLRSGESFGALSPNWTTIATVPSVPRRQGLVRLWEVGPGRLRRTLLAPGNSESSDVLQVAFSPDGRMLAYVTNTPRGTLQALVWDLPSGRLKQRLSVPEGAGMSGDIVSMAFAPDGKMLALIGVAEDPSGEGEHAVVRLWDLQTGKTRRTLSGAGNVSLVLFSPDGKTLAGVSRAYDDPTVRLWDVATGRLKRVLRGHRTGVRSAAFSLDGKRLASACLDGVVRLWEVATGKLIRALPGAADYTSAGVILVLSPDGKRLTVGGDQLPSGVSYGVVRRWNLETGRLEQKLVLPTESSVLAVSADGARVAAEIDGSVQVWSMR